MYQNHIWYTPTFNVNLCQFHQKRMKKKKSEENLFSIGLSHTVYDTLKFAQNLWDQNKQ